MRPQEARDLLREQYDLLRGAMESYYESLTRQECSSCHGGKTIQKEVSNRGLGALKDRDGRALPAFDSLLTKQGRSYDRALAEIEEALAQLVRAVKRYCNRQAPWVLARERRIAEGLGFLRGWKEGAKTATAEAVATVEAVAGSLPKPATEKPAAPEGKPLSEAPKRDEVRRSLRDCVRSAAREAGLDASAFDVVFRANAPGTIVVRHAGKEELFSATEKPVSMRGACRRIAGWVHGFKRKAEPDVKQALPNHHTAQFILAAWGERPENITTAEILRRLEETYSLTPKQRTEIGNDHRRLVASAHAAGIMPSGDVATEHGLTITASAQPAGETLESLATFGKGAEKELARLGALPLAEAEAAVVAMERAVNKANLGIASVLEGRRPVGVTSNASEIEKLKRHNEGGGTPKARWTKVTVPMSKRDKNLYWTYWLEPNREAGEELARLYGELMHDELRSRSSVTAERYADVSRRLGYSDQNIRDFFLARRARADVNARKGEERTETPAIRFARVERREGGDFVELAFVSKPPREVSDALREAGLEMVASGPDAPFYRSLKSAKALAAVRRFSAVSELPKPEAPKTAESAKEASKGIPRVFLFSYRSAPKSSMVTAIVEVLGDVPTWSTDDKDDHRFEAFERWRNDVENAVVVVMEEPDVEPFYSGLSQPFGRIPDEYAAKSGLPKHFMHVKAEAKTAGDAASLVAAMKAAFLKHGFVVSGVFDDERYPALTTVTVDGGATKAAPKEEPMTLSQAQKAADDAGISMEFSGQWAMLDGYPHLILNGGNDAWTARNFAFVDGVPDIDPDWSSDRAAIEWGKRQKEATAPEYAIGQEVTTAASLSARPVEDRMWVSADTENIDGSPGKRKVGWYYRIAGSKAYVPAHLVKLPKGEAAPKVEPPKSAEPPKPALAGRSKPEAKGPAFARGDGVRYLVAFAKAHTAKETQDHESARGWYLRPLDNGDAEMLVKVGSGVVARKVTLDATARLEAFDMGPMPETAPKSAEEPYASGSVRERAAAVLGWSASDVNSMSLPALRDLLVHQGQPKLVAEIAGLIRGGSIVRGDAEPSKSSEKPKPTAEELQAAFASMMDARGKPAPAPAPAPQSSVPSKPPQRFQAGERVTRDGKTVAEVIETTGYSVANKGWRYDVRVQGGRASESWGEWEMRRAEAAPAEEPTKTKAQEIADKFAAKMAAIGVKEG